MQIPRQATRLARRAVRDLPKNLSLCGDVIVIAVTVTAVIHGGPASAVALLGAMR